MNVSRLFTSAVLCLSALNLQAQEQVLVFGIETSFNFFSQSEIRKTAFTTPIGAHVEYPVGQFSFGTGLLLVNYGTFSYQTYNGDILTTMHGGYLRKNYVHEVYEAKTHYIGIPLRVQYRLPCNCIYLQASLETDILTGNYEPQMQGTTVSYRRAMDFDYNALKQSNQRFAFGVGFKLHHTKYARIYMRPEYEYILNPWTAYNDSIANDTHALKITMGAQFGYAYGYH